MNNKIWVLTYTIGTNEGRKSRRLICDTKEQAIMQQSVLGGDLVEYLRKPEAFKVNWPEKIDIGEELEKAQQRIAELESRTVKLQKLKMLEDYLAEVAIEERKQILVGVKLEFHRACVAAGIKWEAE